MTHGTEYTSLYQAATTAESLQALVDRANALSGLPIVLADSIHNVIAASRDVGKDPDWNDLIERGWLPQPPPSEEAHRMPLPIQVSQAPPVRLSRCALPDGKITYNGDLRDGEHIVLKIAVMKTDGSASAEAFANALAESMYLLYFRMIHISGESLSGRGQYLLSLIQGKRPAKRITAQWFGVQSPFCLLVFPKPPEGVVALSFSQVVSTMEPLFGFCVRTVSPNEELVLLMQAPDDWEAFLRELNSLLRQHIQPAGISMPFEDLSSAQVAYLQAVRSLKAATDFSGFCRCAVQEEFAVFQMFRLAENGDPEDLLLHEDAKHLAAKDEDHTARYLETLFTWLYYEKNAAVAAKHLFVHRNTLDNRMRKITVLVKADWGNRGYCTRMLYSAWLLLKRDGQLRDSLLQL